MRGGIITIRFKWKRWRLYKRNIKNYYNSVFFFEDYLFAVGPLRIIYHMMD